MKKKAFLFFLILLFLFSLPASKAASSSGNQILPSAPSQYLRLSELVEAPSVLSKSNPYSVLSVPTCVIKIRNTYFISDCYHKQILYSDSLQKPIKSWNVMTDQVNLGHTLASDGTVYLADDTENHSVLVFERSGNGFMLTQRFSSIGTRPHFVVYDEATARFYVLSSMTGEIYVFARLDGSSRVALQEVRRIDQLNGVYVRSFTIIGDEIYFVSGNSSILRARLSNLEILEEYPVPPEIAGMIQLMKIQEEYYITVSTDLYGNQDYATLIRTPDLHSLASGNYEDLYSLFIGGGTPYYMGSFDGHYYLTEHRIPGHTLWQFDVLDNTITQVRKIF